MTATQKWQCVGCGNFKDAGCGMPNLCVPIHYSDGTTEMAAPACPLALVTVRVSLLTRIKELFLK